MCHAWLRIDTSLGWTLKSSKVGPPILGLGKPFEAGLHSLDCNGRKNVVSFPEHYVPAFEAKVWLGTRQIPNVSTIVEC